MVILWILTVPGECVYLERIVQGTKELTALRDVARRVNLNSRQRLLDTLLLNKSRARIRFATTLVLARNEIGARSREERIGECKGRSDRSKEDERRGDHIDRSSRR